MFVSTFGCEVIRQTHLPATAVLILAKTRVLRIPDSAVLYIDFIFSAIISAKLVYNGVNFMPTTSVVEKQIGVKDAYFH